MRRRESRFEVIVEGTPLGLAVSVHKDGREITETAGESNLPPEIAYLMRSSYKHDISIPLVVFLKRAEVATRSTTAVGRPGGASSGWATCDAPAWTDGLDARGGEIVARKACSLEKERTDPGTLIGDFVFNEQRTRMGRVSGDEGWYFYELLKETCQRNRIMAARLRHMDGREFSMPVDVFSRGFAPVHEEDKGQTGAQVTLLYNRRRGGAGRLLSGGRLRAGCERG